jgi:hypothetical protein
MKARSKLLRAFAFSKLERSFAGARRERFQLSGVLVGYSAPRRPRNTLPVEG